MSQVCKTQDARAHMCITLINKSNMYLSFYPCRSIGCRAVGQRIGLWSLAFLVIFLVITRQLECE